MHGTLWHAGTYATTSSAASRLCQASHKASSLNASTPQQNPTHQSQRCRQYTPFAVRPSNSVGMNSSESVLAPPHMIHVSGMLCCGPAVDSFWLGMHPNSMNGSSIPCILTLGFFDLLLTQNSARAELVVIPALAPLRSWDQV